VRIQLDYYRILGLTPSAKLNQIDQAHSDRIKSLPRREYSDKAISLRQKLLDVAHTVLADTSQRQVYDAQILPKLIKAKDEDTFFIEIDQRELAGAFLILYELGEYDQIIELSKDASLDLSDRDLVLSTILAYLELGQENWHQGRYELAAKNFEKGVALIEKNKVEKNKVEKNKDEAEEKSELFPELKQELLRNICQLQPYQILELMSLGSTTQGINLLKELLDQRHGIDGKGDDRTGLNIDKFLQFILELRVYMTCAEQEALFEAETLRPSLVASYLAVYALIATGISQSQPALIRRGKNLLNNISKSQNVYLEEAMCALLLGQVEEAINLLNLSDETEKIALIYQMADDRRINNQSDRHTDLFSGLYNFTQSWLDTEIYPQFKDLIGRSVDLDAYFNNQNVQAYIIRLPTLDPVSRIFPPIASESNALPISELPISIFRQRDRIVERQVELQVERQVEGQTTESNVSTATATRSRPRSKLDRRPRYRFYPRRLVLFLVSLMGIVGGAVALGYTTWNFINASNKELVVQSEPVLSPIINTSIANIKPIKILAPNLSKEIDREIAGEIVTNWQKIKADALGRKFKVNELEQILTEPLLSEWRSRAENLKSSNSYLEYTLKSAVVQEFKSATKNQASVLTDISEVRNYFVDGQLNREESKADNYRVEYVLSKVGDRWLISAMNLKPKNDP